MTGYVVDLDALTAKIIHTITGEDVRRGVRASCKNCPSALALTRALSHVPRAPGEGSGLWLTLEAYPLRHVITLRGGVGLVADTPKALREKIEAFDGHCNPTRRAKFIEETGKTGWGEFTLEFRALTAYDRKHSEAFLTALAGGPLEHDPETA